MRKPNVCLCGPVDSSKESALESKIQELVNYSDSFFENIYIYPTGTMTFSDPGIYSYVKQVELQGKIGRLMDKGHRFIPYVCSALPFLGNKYKIDLFDISFAYNAGLLTKISRWKEVPTVVNALGSDIVVRKEYDYGFRLHNLNDFAIKSSLKNATRICTLSEFMKKLLMEYEVPNEKIEIIPTGVNTEDFQVGQNSNFRAQYGLTDCPVIMYLGSILPIKAVINLIKAARLIKDAVRDVKFVFMHFYTESKYVEECWNLIESLGLKNDVFYLGAVPHRFIPDLLAGCDVYMHASFSESLGRSILEAMASGKPVVVSNAGAMPEYVRDGETGFLATPGKPEEYATSVIRLLGDSTLRESIGMQARKMIEAEYSLKTTAGKRLAMFEKLLS